MFEQLFSYPAAVRRHCEGPLASERPEYLQYLKDREAASGTVVRQARYCLCIAQEIQQWPREHRPKTSQLESIAASWAARRATQGWAATPRWPKENFLSVARSFLERFGRLQHDPAPPPGRYDAWLEDFLQAECRERGLALATHKIRQWHIRRFLSYLDQKEYSLEGLTPDHVDTYLKYLGQTWNRVSLRSTAHALRSWFRYCEIMGRTPQSMRSPQPRGIREKRQEWRARLPFRRRPSRNCAEWVFRLGAEDFPPSGMRFAEGIILR
jgi:hypothetical protein